MESKFGDIQEGDFRAELLTEVLCVLDATANGEQLEILFDRANVLRAKKGVKELDLPRGPEELRDRIKRVMAVHAYAKARYVTRPWLQGLEPIDWDRHVEYFLSERVYRLDAKDSSGSPICSPSWALVLNYEQQVRTKAMRLLADGEERRLSEALVAARKDGETRERYFLTPLAVTRPGGEQRTRSRSGRRDQGRPITKPSKGRREPTSSSQKGGQKRGRKGDGKGKLPDGRFAGMTRNNRDEQGKPICYDFNMLHQNCSKSPCKMSHCCWWCFGSHEGFECAKYKEALKKNGRGGRKGE